LISSSTGIWFVLSHSRLLLIVSGQWIRSILRRQLLINTCIYMMAFVVVQVSAPYSRTILTFVLKILTLVLVTNCFEFQMFFNCKYAALALPIRAFISASGPSCSSMMLPRYVKVFTSSKSSPSIVIGLVHSVLYRRTLLFPLCILRPIAAEAASTLFVFSCICCCFWDRMARSSAKSRSSNCILSFHCISCFPSDVDVFMIQLITSRKRTGESKQPCLTPVFTSNEFVNCSPCTILHNFITPPKVFKISY
uniref:Product n=1 Tax=Schistosoma curassoni TaxID=6186 RepID=A0A183L1M8_9TREM